jgi:Tol biopolymer transport system component
MHSLDVDGSQAGKLPGSENAGFPFWSPDSTRIAFFQGGQIVTMTPTGGSRTIIARTKEGDPLRGVIVGSWGRDNAMLLAAAGKLFKVPAVTGSEPAEMSISGVDGRLNGPTFLPDGRHFLVCGDSKEGGAIYLASLDDPRALKLGPSTCPGGFAPPDHVLYLRGGSIVAQRLDLRRFALDGDPQTIASNVARGSLGPWPVLTLSASDTGALAFPAPRGGSSLGRLTWFDRSGHPTGTIEPPSDGVEYLNPAVSPKQDLVAANRLDPVTGAWHIWLIDGARNNAASRLTTDSAPDFDPAWSPDGSEVIYVSDRDGRRKLYRLRIAGGAPVEVLDVSSLGDPIPSDVSPDGRILFSDLQRSIWLFRPGDPAPTKGSPTAYGAHVSPDGKWLAYARSQGGAFDIYVERFPGGSPQKKISIGSGTHPRWANGGREVVYWTPPGGIVSTTLTLTDGDIRVGETRTLVPEPAMGLIDARTAYDITRDGQRILMRQQAGPPSPGIRVIVNWMSKLK